MKTGGTEGRKSRFDVRRSGEEQPFLDLSLSSLEVVADQPVCSAKTRYTSGSVPGAILMPETCSLMPTPRKQHFVKEMSQYVAIGNDSV
jgi:hypothetical protein